MKKTLFITLTLVLCFVLYSCDTNSKEHGINTVATTIESSITEPITTESITTTKEDLLASAELFSANDYRTYDRECAENPVRAAENYKDKIIKTIGRVTEIHDKYITISLMDNDYYFSDYCKINAFLSLDEILALSNGDVIAVVGQNKATNLTLNTAYTIPLIECRTENINEMIEIFGNDDDDDACIENSDGSYGFFRIFEETFPLLPGYDIKEKLIGSWDVSDKFGHKFEHTFKADGTATTTYLKGDDNCPWLVQGDYVYWGTSSAELNVSSFSAMSVRILNDNTLIFYTYDAPYAILKKK